MFSSPICSPLVVWALGLQGDPPISSQLMLELWAQTDSMYEANCAQSDQKGPHSCVEGTFPTYFIQTIRLIIRVQVCQSPKDVCPVCPPDLGIQGPLEPLDSGTPGRLGGQGKGCREGKPEFRRPLRALRVPFSSSRGHHWVSPLPCEGRGSVGPPRRLVPWLSGQTRSLPRVSR